MNKSQLKEVIQNIVARKLDEVAKQKPAKYGYIMADKDSDDPRLQMIGYGNMPKSYWKKKILNDLEALKRQVEDENWNGAAHLVEKNGVLYSSINMMKEIFEQRLQEIDVNPDTSAGETGLSDADKKELANLKAQSDKITTNVKKIEGDVAKLQSTIQPKLQRAERMKAKLQKQQSDVIRKQQAIQDKA